MHCFWANKWYRIHEPCVYVCKSSDTLWFINQIRPLKFHLNLKSGEKYFYYMQKSKIWAQKMDEFAIHCSCRIRKSVKISLWIRNPGRNIFKIRRSIRLFTSLHEGLARTWVGVCVLLAFISWHIVHDNSWSTFPVHVVVPSQQLPHVLCGAGHCSKESPRH